MTTNIKLSELAPPTPNDRIPDDQLTREQLLTHTDNLRQQLKRAVGQVAFHRVVADSHTRAYENEKQKGRALNEENKRLQYEATHDPMTGLHNRKVINHDGEATKFFEAHIGESAFGAVLDLNGLKGRNDAYGHAAGDAVIKLFAKACQESIRFEEEENEVSPNIDRRNIVSAKDFAIRTGGDEVFFAGLGGSEVGENVMKRIMTRFEELQREEISNLTPLTCSYGVVEFDNGDVAAAMDAADEFARAAKDQYYEQTGNIRRR